jgi:DNA-binding CsgD family transcriptional regulator
MTVRERELLGHLITGGDTRDIAATMVLSQHTIRDHLKSMFGKASVHSRRALLTRALGT